MNILQIPYSIVSLSINQSINQMKPLDDPIQPHSESHPNIPLREEDSMKWFDVQQEDDTLIEHRTQILESLLQPKQSFLHKRNHFEIPSH